MRLFTGIALAPNVEARLAGVLAELRPLASIKWSPVENLHITLKFIGEWPEERLPELQTALGSVTAAPIRVHVAGFGYFSYSLFAGVQADSGLAELVTEIDRTLAPLGLTPESRAYRPHVTLARGLRKPVAGLADSDFGSFEAREFHLYLSRNSVYTKLATYDLMRENNKIP